MRTPCSLLLIATALSCPLFAQLPVVHPLFETDTVHDIHLTFESPNWYEQLRLNFEGVDDPAYLEATFTWGEIHMERVGVRFKGNSSYRTYPGTKKSFKIKTNEFVKGRRIEGIDTLNLNNAFKDPSYLREKIYYELAREAGLKAPRVNHAALYVNGEYWGLYFLTEDIDGEFLENHVAAKENGNMYKGDPRGTLEWRGPDAAPYKREYEKDNNEDADDWSDLIQFVDTLNRTPRESLKERLDEVLDLDSAAALLAVDLLTANLDSYIGSGHNYYLYHRKSDGKFMFFPWDPNEAFGNFNMGLSLNDLQRLPLQWLPRPQTPPPGQPAPPPNATMPRPLAQRIYEIPEYRAVYLQKVKQLIEGAAEPERLLERMHALHQMLRPYVERETRSMFTVAQFERSLAENQRTGGPGQPGQPGQPGSPLFDIPGLEPFLRARIESVRQQLDVLLPPE